MRQACQHCLNAERSSLAATKCVLTSNLHVLSPRPLRYNGYNNNNNISQLLSFGHLISNIFMHSIEAWSRGRRPRNWQRNCKLVYNFLCKEWISKIFWPNYITIIDKVQARYNYWSDKTRKFRWQTWQTLRKGAGWHN